MAKRITWNASEIVVLEGYESIQNQCSAGDAAVSYFNGKDDSDGWGVTFVGDDGSLNGWGEAFASADEAVESIRNA